MISYRSTMSCLTGVVLFFASNQVGNSQEKQDQSRKQRPNGKNTASAAEHRRNEDSGAVAASILDSAYKGEKPPEAARMLSAILRGSQMGPGEGWFGPAETRYTWQWLAKRCGVDPSAKSGIPRKKFPGPDALFAKLDRDKDGAITPGDFDWSDRNPYVQMANIANRVFRRLNAKGNGQLTKEELLHFFNEAAHGKSHVSADDFREALLAGWTGGGGKPSDMPTQAVLIRGLFAGEIGSMNEGPKVNWLAPDFALKTVDGTKTIHLAKLIESKPVVLVFGSFT